MGLENHVLDNKEVDDYVFRTLLRCMKENNGYRLTTPLSVIIDRCYNSRKSHPSENILSNICYWPNDCHLMFSTDILMLYYAKLLNGPNFRKLPGWNLLKERFVGSLSNLTGGLTFFPMETKTIMEHSSIIEDAIHQVFDGENADNIAIAYKMALMAINEELPL